MKQFFNATEIGLKCGKSVFDYLDDDYQNYTKFRTDGVWLHQSCAPDYIKWCLTETKDFTFTLREYVGEREWVKIYNTALYGKQFKKMVLSGNVPDIEYVGTDTSKRRDVYKWI